MAAPLGLLRAPVSTLVACAESLTFRAREAVAEMRRRWLFLLAASVCAAVVVRLFASPPAGWESARDVLADMRAFGRVS